jgi:hypothetical protein
MPKPRTGESRSEFISRCVPDVMKEGMTQAQAVGKCEGMYTHSQKLESVNKSIRQLNVMIRAQEHRDMVAKYQPEVMKAMDVYGYESPDAGNLAEEGKTLLTTVYAQCRKDGGEKEYCSKVAWTAVTRAGHKTVSRVKIMKSIENNIRKLASFYVVKNDPIKQDAEYQGIKIGLEWLNGEERQWKGSPYRNPMVGTGYGYINNTVDGDGEEVDVYLADPVVEDAPVFMMNQKKKDGTFDEHKFFLGFKTQEDAETAFLNAMPKEMMGEMLEMTVEEFKEKYLKFHSKVNAPAIKESGNEPTGEKWIGVDLDGTLAIYDGWKGVGHIGSPIKEMVDRVKQWLDEGKKVKILTARVSGDNPEKAKETIQKWTEKQFGQRLEVTSEKDMDMEELWDDRAVTVEMNTGKIKTE